MNETRWQIAVRGGGDLTGAVVMVTCDMGQTVVDRQFQIVDCLTSDGDTRVYAAQEI